MDGIAWAFTRQLALAVATIVLTMDIVGCADMGDGGLITASDVRSIVVHLKNGETFEYPTASGDEEGARITKQAVHFNISEIRRNATTSFVAVLIYQPKTGFAGIDYVELEISTGSNGVGPPTRITKLGFRFIVSM